MIIQMGDEKLCELFMKPDVFFFINIFVCIFSNFQYIIVNLKTLL